MFKSGTAFWIQKEEPPHLWFVLSDPAIDDQKILLVNLTSFHSSASPNDAENDPACLIYPGEHPFIVRPTCVFYYGAMVASLAFLEAKLKKKLLRLDDPASPVLLKKMRECAGNSRHMTPGDYNLLVLQGLVE